MKTFIGILLLLGLFGSAKAQNVHVQHGQNYKNNVPYLVILSMDGFRWDYPEFYHTPNLDSLARVGVKAKSMMPCFPSKTFPNHYSIVTGLYPENHGIVFNSFHDPALGDFRLSDRKAVQNAAFYLGEPIWVTAEKQHVRSASFFWPGSEAAIEGIYPDIWKKYDSSVSYKARIDSVIGWLKRPVKSRPHLILWYFDQPDHVGHHEGPKSEQTREVVEHLDSLVGEFCQKINALDIADSINLVFTSDHGMESISSKKAIDVDHLVKDTWVKQVEWSNPVMLIQPNPDCKDSILTVLKNQDHLQVYTKQTMPQKFHYNKSDRIFDLVCVADSSWSIYWKKKKHSNGGTHGYDPDNTDVHAIFYASGPAFKRNFVQPTFRNIDLYDLFAHILGLKPVKTDGNFEEVRQMLKNDH